MVISFQTFSFRLINSVGKCGCYFDKITFHKIHFGKLSVWQNVRPKCSPVTNVQSVTQNVEEFLQITNELLNFPC